MVKYNDDQLNTVFSALGDPTRRAIMARLAAGETTVGALAAPHAMSLPAVTKHLGVLEKAQLIHRTKDGRVVRCRLAPAPLQSAANWIDAYKIFWDGQLDALADYLDETKLQD